MTLTNTTATDTGYYSCKIISDHLNILTVKELFMKKYVYFFGSYLFTFMT